MGKNTKIEWTDATWNPIRGCSRVSEGCRNCYAESVAARFSDLGQPYHGLAEFKIIGKDTPNERTEAHWTGEVAFVPEHLDDPLRWKKPAKIFVNSMSDLFHEKVQDEWIEKIMQVILACPEHIFQVLTKRPERMGNWVRNWKVGGVKFIPPPNLWLGVSVEDQKTADERIPLLLEIPAAVRWVSYEPALGPVNFQNWVPRGIDWIVMGGESGKNARPMHPKWARDVRDLCKLVSTPFWFKQWGEWFPRTDAVDISRRHCVWKDDVATFPNNWSVCRLHLNSGNYMERIGKKLAGSLLDGDAHREFPE